MTAILEMHGLTKHFRHNWTMRRFVALDGLDLAVPEGEIFGLIGPNGAGKTTTLKIVLGLLRPSSGTVRFRGQPLTTAARAAIGFLPEQPYFYDYLTVQETLDHVRPAVRTARRRAASGASARSSSRCSSATSAAPRCVRCRRARCSASASPRRMLNDPQLLILDEPMSGLDPVGRHAMRELIRALHASRDDGDLLLAHPAGRGGRCATASQSSRAGSCAR